MELLSTLPVVVLVVAVALYAVIFRRRNEGPPLPPGPTGLPIVGSLPFLHSQLHVHFAELARTYGPIFSIRLGSSLAVVVTSPAVAREILKENDAVFANHEPTVAARTFNYGGAGILFRPLGPEWRMLRRITVSKLLSGPCLESGYGLRRRQIRSTLRELYERSGEPIDVGRKIFSTMLNVITSTMWGSTVAECEEGTSAGGEALREKVTEVMEFVGKPNVSDFIPALARFDLQGLEKRMLELRDSFDRFFDTVVQQKRLQRQVTKMEKDFLDILLELEAGGDKDSSDDHLTMIQIKALLLDILIGATDTTTTTLEWAMAETMAKPEVLKKALEEVDKVVGRNSMVEESHIPSLPYIGCIIKEALRLHPTVPLLIPHYPSTSCMISGYRIPKGTNVFFNVWAIHRDALLWRDPTEFVPERFASIKRDFSGREFDYFPFGSGRRICVGMVMAEKMTAFVLAALLHSFDWELQDGTASVDRAERYGMSLKKATPLIVVPTPRLQSPQLYC